MDRSSVLTLQSMQATEIPRKTHYTYHSYRWQWQTCVSRSITLHLGGKALGIYYRQDCAEKTIYALKIVREVPATSC